MFANTIKYLYYISIIQKLISGAYYLPHSVISTEDTTLNNKKPVFTFTSGVGGRW